MFRHSVYLILLFSFCMGGIAAAQPAREWRVTHFTTEDGLPSNEVGAIVQDSLGFLWISTGNGLVRYDGYTFTTYLPRPGDSTTIGATDVSELHVDAKGRLWAGGNIRSGGGLSRYDPDTEQFTRYQHDPDDPSSLPADAVAGLGSFPASPDEVWVVTIDWPAGVGGGLSRLNVQKAEFTNFQRDSTASGGLPSNLVWRMHATRDSRFWIATIGQGIGRFDPKLGTVTQILPSSVSTDYPPAIYEDSYGILWVGTEGRGLVRFDPKENVATSFLPAAADPTDPRNHIFDVLEDRGGTLWVGTDDGLYTFDRTTHLFSRFPHQPVTPQIRGLFEDRTGVIWVGLYGEGLMKLESWTNPFVVYRHDPDDANSLAESRVWPILLDSRGILWIGNLRHLNRLDRTSGTVIRYDPGVVGASLGLGSYSNVVSLHEDRGGSLWVGMCFAGLVRMDLDRPGQFEDFVHDPDDPGSLGSGCVNPMLEDRAGKFWISLWGGGIDRMDRKTGTFTHFTRRSHGLGDDQVLRLYEAPSQPGILWAGREQGMSRFDTSAEAFTNYDDERLLRTMMMHEDRAGHFWVATASSGLHLFDRERGEIERSYTTEDGLAHNVVWSILEDDEGYFWLSTSNGLSRFDPETRAFRNFYAHDGLPGNLFNEHGHHRGRNGELFFGSTSGAVSFSPSDIAKISFPPDVVLTDLFVKGMRAGIGGSSPLKESVTSTSDVRLSYEQNDVALHYVGLSARNPDYTQYRYMLDGYDGQWVDAGAQRTARYPHLPPGTYTFRVTASSGDGVWNETPTTLAITVLPPWWRTWWAYALYGFVFAGGVFAVDRIQRRRLIKKERERARERELEQAREIERAYRELETAHRDLETAHADLEDAHRRLEVTLQHLQTTQAQLVHQQKLASLGALTAGIAHEIQNPLNFVNNFSQLSSELLDELSEMLESGGDKPARDILGPVEAVLEDLKTNAAKITEHGRRADSIIKNMLLHSRGRAGERKPTDLNALVDEYVALAYHGMRAQDQDFQCMIEKRLDPTLEPVAMVPQDIARVLLNLLNNAFYAVGGHSKDADEYLPEVRVSTHSANGQVEVSVEDNGPGIPEEIRGQIFEPFFTTKPTGEGTGLGLSLSHEIITQGHGGTLTVESEEGRRTAFTIALPTKTS